MFPALICIIVLFFLTRQFLFALKYDLHKVPSPPKLPFLGHLHHLLPHPRLRQNKFILEWYHKLGRPKLMLKQFPGDTSLVIFDEEFIKTKVLGRDEMPRDKIYMNLKSVFVGDHHPWLPSQTVPFGTPYTQAIRKCVAQSFSANHIRNTFPNIKRVVRKAMMVLEEKGSNRPLDLHPLFGHMTIDIVGDVGLEIDLGALDGNGKIYDCFLHAFESFTEKIFNPHLKFYAKLFPSSRVAMKWKNRQEAIFGEHEKLIEEIWNRPYPGEDNHLLWANLRRLIDPETNKPIEKKRVSGELISIIGAATDTSGHQLGWIFALLSDHEEVVEKLLSHMKELGLYGPDARDPEFSDLAALPYLTAIIKECMRMINAISLLGCRCTKEDMTIFGYRIPKNTQIYIPSNVYGHLEENFESPEEFKPERWLNGKAKNKFYVPFSYGPRDCAGQRLAMLEMQLTLLMMLPKFKIKLANGFTIKDVEEKQMFESVMMEAEGGLNFDISLRN